MVLRSLPLAYLLILNIETTLGFVQFNRPSLVHDLNSKHHHVLVTKYHGRNSIITKSSLKVEINTGIQDPTLTINNNSNNGNGDIPGIYESPEMKVYIEDTDAYKVMYNTNYLKVYGRALEHFQSEIMSNDETLTNNSSSEIFDDSRSSHSSPSSSSSMLKTNNNWFIINFESRFLAPPTLGESYIISGRIVETDVMTEMNMEAVELNGEEEKNKSTNKTVEIWEMEMKWGDKVFNKAKVIISNDLDSNTRSHDKSSTKSGRLAQHDFNLYRDELGNDLHQSLPSGYVPLRSALNVFERSRTMFLGGPEKLEKLQNEDNILYVVTRIDDCCYIIDNCNEEGGDDHMNCNDDAPATIPLSQKYRVETEFVSKRGGMIIECNQVLLMPHENSPSSSASTTTNLDSMRPIAQAKIIIAALNAQTKRPTRKIPEWAKSIIEI